MGTTVFHGDDGAITQKADAWTYDPVAPVLLKSDGDPGVAPHSNTSEKIWNALSSIFESGVEFANRFSAMDVGQHALQVLVGWPTEVRDHPNGFLSWAKEVFHEAGEMVHHGVETAVNSIMQMLSPELKQAIDNGEEILKGMSTEDFKEAAAEKLQELLEMLKDPSTYAGLAVTLAATAVQGVPVVGQVVGGAVAVQRIANLGEAGIQATKEIKDIMSTWGQKMTPEQMAEARKKLAAWMLGVGFALLAALVGKAIKFARNAKSKKINDHTSEAHSNKASAEKSPCACALPNPVLIVTGEKLLEETDFELPGPIPLVWRRRYRSGDQESGPWGACWSHPLWMELRLGPAGVIWRDEQGRHVRLPRLQPGQSHFELREALTLHRLDETRWSLEFKTGLTLHFRQSHADAWRLPLLEQSDRNGNRVQLHWQSASAAAGEFAPPVLSGITDSAGRRLQLHWQDQRLRQVHLLARGGVSHELASYTYDERGQLIASHRGGQPWRQYAWRSGVLVGYRKGNGARYFADYDAEGPHGRVLRSWCADTGESHRFRYEFSERITWVTDALERTTGYRYNEGFDIVETLHPDGSRTQTPMNAAHLPLGSVDPLGRRSSSRYDARGNLTGFTSADGAHTQLEYNAQDLPVRITDPLGQVWLRQYDPRGNLTASTDPAGHGARYEHDSRGNVIAIIDAAGKRKTIQWDAQGNLSAYTDCSGRRSSYRHDRQGRLIERMDALGQITRYGWNAA
ncbi:MAG: DUF6531 domain-containing protein, partial [Desulfovibrionaceae bacterium]|nr:DUF6531 domain-containing protein [Desulfovibrionaceae bacterium]